MDEAMKGWIQKVREDHLVGRGTCSVIDECYTDAELEEALRDAGIKGKIESVRWARRVERMYREREREAHAEIF